MPEAGSVGHDLFRRIDDLGHLQSLTLPKTKAWRQVVDLLEGGAEAEDILAAAVRAAETATKFATSDPAFQEATRILVELPLAARGPGYASFLEELGAGSDSVSGFLASLTRALDRTSATTDLGEMAKMSLISAFGDEIQRRVPSLYEPSAADIRSAIGQLAGGDGFSDLTRRFYADVTRQTLSYYLSRVLASHTGPTKRFTDDAQRVAFDSALKTHTWEAAGIVREFASGWYGKTIWQGDGPTPEKIAKFSAYAFKKVRDELGRRRDAA